MKKLTKEQKRDIAAVAARTGAEIDLTDIPEVWTGGERKSAYFIGLNEPPVTLPPSPAPARARNTPHTAE